MEEENMEEKITAEDTFPASITDSAVDDIILSPKHEDIIIEYVKEKDNLRAELQDKDKEIQKLKSAVYDLNAKLEEARKKGKHKNKDASAAKDIPVASQMNGDHVEVEKPTNVKIRTPGTKRKAAKRRKGRHSKANKNASPEPFLMRADMDKYDNVPDIIAHYVDMSEQFPDIKLAVLLEAEKTFYETDTNNDGTIDAEEMEKMLMKQGYLFTNAELKTIMNEIDIDQNNSIELMEYVAIMDKIQQRKKVNLPQELTKSKLCIIQ